jgi:hypothetical protein
MGSESGSTVPCRKPSEAILVPPEIGGSAAGVGEGHYGLTPAHLAARALPLRGPV